MKRLTLREIQLEEVDILKKLTDFIDKNNLSYYLCSGTLLGAVRHKGFIPWDDDIDICLPRPDYDKLINILKTNKIDEDLEAISLEFNNSKYPFCKIINKKIKINSKSKQDNYLWVDIFPFDGLPDNQEEHKKINKKILFYRGIIYLHTTAFSSILKENKSTKNKIIKVLLKPISMLISPKLCSKKMDKISRKYDYETSKYVANIMWGNCYGQALEKDILFSGKKLLDFEQYKFVSPAEYDYYLSGIYGDYMTLPKEEDRATHHVEAYKD